MDAYDLFSEFFDKWIKFQLVLFESQSNWRQIIAIPNRPNIGFHTETIDFFLVTHFRDFYLIRCCYLIAHREIHAYI